MQTYDVIIVGLGPAGCAAGIYATRYGLETLVIGKEPGGQANEAYEVDNYPGFLGAKGMDMMNKFREHAKALGAELVTAEVFDIKRKGGIFFVSAGDEEYVGKSLIIATGSRKRKLNIPGERDLIGRGVSYCATCDAPLFRGKTVCVIGGGTSAVMSALMLAEHAQKVYLVYRKEKKEMRAVPLWIRKAEKNEKIEMLFSSLTKRIEGYQMVEAVVFEKAGKELKLKVDGVFIEAGSEPRNELAKKLGVELDDRGKINVSSDMSTDSRGVFAAGDITNGSSGFEQIIVAAAEGALAARSAYGYLKK